MHSIFTERRVSAIPDRANNDAIHDVYIVIITRLNHIIKTCFESLEAWKIAYKNSARD